MRKANLCLMILEAVTFILLFMPCVFTERLYYHGHEITVEDSNFFRNGTEIPLVLGIVFAILLFVLLCFLIDNVILNNYRKHTDEIIRYGTRIVAFVFTLISVINIAFDYLSHSSPTIEDEIEGNWFEVSFCWLWYVMIVIQLFAVAFSFVKQKKEEVIPAVHPMQAYTSETYSNNVEELKKYKDLLDQGVIAQDEFESKKKQLLGL